MVEDKTFKAGTINMFQELQETIFIKLNTFITISYQIENSKFELVMIKKKN